MHKRYPAHECACSSHFEPTCTFILELNGHNAGSHTELHSTKYPAKLMNTVPVSILPPR